MLLEVRQLKTVFPSRDGEHAAVDGVSFSLRPGQALGIVGESGCGKSVTAQAIVGLVPFPGRISQGEILYRNRNMTTLSEHEFLQIRGRKIALLFQESSAALSPVHTVGEQIVETIRLHNPELSRSQAKDRAIQLLKKVGIAAPAVRMRDYVHQLSGGMKQRVMLAMTISCRPEILIADEPTTGLDVTIQLQILELLRQWKKESGGSLILISHDFSVVSEMCDTLAVMYAGQIVEQGPMEALLQKPRHWYTRGLIASIPQTQSPGERLHAIPGVVPRFQDFPQGCRFATRCERAEARCHAIYPTPTKDPASPERWLACHFPVPP